MIWRLPCGDYTIYAIEDGYIYREPLEHFTQSTAADWSDQILEPDGRIRSQFGCYLLEAGDRRIMVDVGMGSHREGDFVAGQTPAALERLGVDRDSIELIVQTHMHFDHIGGTLSTERAAMYPNARHVFHRAEWAHWSTSDTPGGEAARWVLEPLLDVELVDFIDEPTAFGPGIESVDTPGHTPGHLSVRLASAGTEVLIGGDLSNHPLQVRHPDWNVPFDNDPNAAATTRRRMFDELSGTGILFLAGHYPAPGFGRIEPDDDGYRFEPLEADTVG